MKLLRYGAKGVERPAILDEAGNIRDLSDVVEDIDGRALSPQHLARLAALDTATLPRVDGGPRIGPCVASVGKLVCIGLNYADHAEESGAPIPDEPLIFMKATSSICGPQDDIEIPRGSEKTDWEVELGIVIGREAKYVEEADAFDYIAGYCIVNDVSERHFQLEGTGQWVKGKSHDSFAPLGPWLVTRQEVADVQDLGMWLDVNGHRYQNGSTRTMIFTVPHIVAYVSRFMSLQPGDVISTGTPPGVGLGLKPPSYLKAGDVVTLGVSGLGEQRQRCVASA